MCTAFIVEKKFGGITTQKCNTLLDCDISDVQFNNTFVPAGEKYSCFLISEFYMLVLENVLGLELKSQDVVSSILTESRLSTSASCTTLMKELVGKFTEDCKNINVGGTNVIETDSVLTKIGDVSYLCLSLPL